MRRRAYPAILKNHTSLVYYHKLTRELHVEAESSTCKPSSARHPETTAIRQSGNDRIFHAWFDPSNPTCRLPKAAVIRHDWAAGR